MEPNPDDASAPAREALVGMLTAPEGSGGVDLDEAALLVAAVLQPGLDIIRWQADLDDLAAQCPAPTRDGVVRHVHALGFRGPGPDYGRWQHSCLDRVLADRVGLPITLAIVMIEVARRLGVELVGVGMPAHFLIGDPRDPEWFVDPFDPGRALDRSECRELFGRLVGERLRWSDDLLAPVPTRAIIIRLLNNLKGGCARFGDSIELARVMRVRAALPEFAHEGPECMRAQAVLN